MKCTGGVFVMHLLMFFLFSASILMGMVWVICPNVVADVDKYRYIHFISGCCAFCLYVSNKSCACFIYRHPYLVGHTRLEVLAFVCCSNDDDLLCIID